MSLPCPHSRRRLAQTRLRTDKRGTLLDPPVIVNGQRGRARPRR